MPLVKTALFALLLATATVGCGDDTESEYPIFDDRADVSGFDIVDIKVGESLEGLSVEKLRVPVDSAQQSDLKRSLVLLKLHLSSDQSASVVMRGTSTGLDSYLILKDVDTGLTIGQNDNQIVVTSLGIRDSLVSLRAGNPRDVLIFASGGVDLHTGGQFAIDVVEHDSPGVDLHTNYFGLETHFELVRSSEAELAEWISVGHVSEKLDGFVEKNPDSISGLALRERVEITRAVDKINGQRADLMEVLINRSGSQIATRESVGQALAAIYSVSRNSQ